MRDAIKRYVETAQSLTEIPRERAEKVARRLAGSGFIDPGQIRGVAFDLVERSRENRRRVTEMVAREIRRQVSRLGIASADEMRRLTQRVQALEVSVRGAGTKRGSARTTQARPRPKTATPRGPGRPTARKPAPRSASSGTRRRRS